MLRSLFTSCALASLLALTSASHAAPDTIRLRVVGVDSATGLIQKNLEAPFFAKLAERTGLPIEVDYKTMDAIGMAGNDTLRAVRTGLYDIILVRFAEQDSAMIDGNSLFGTHPSYEVYRRILAAWHQPTEEVFRKKFNGQLLGAWSFGPQSLYCKPAITGFSDLKGKKVRVYSRPLALFIQDIGGVPVTLPLGETQQALERGLVDCAATGASSGNSAGWPEVTRYFMPNVFSQGAQYYVMNMASWKKFTPDQQKVLQKAFDDLIADIWKYSAELVQDATNCNLGKAPCTTGTKYKLAEVPYSDADQKTFGATLAKNTLPDWFKRCNTEQKGCSELWTRLVGPVVGYSGKGQ